jgi:hypothetical protein
MSTFKVINLFNEHETHFLKGKKRSANLFSDHEAFAEKFNLFYQNIKAA